MNWLDKLKDYAPSIAAAVFSGGATLPQLAAKMISDATGVKVSTVAEAEKVINAATPDQLLAIKKVDNQHAVEMARLGNENFATTLQGFQQARETNKHSCMPMVICLSLTVMVALGAYGLFTMNIPTENKEIAYLLFGTLLAKWGDSIAYWVGTTRSSAEKSKGTMLR